jgi:hypothetical protein
MLRRIKKYFNRRFNRFYRRSRIYLIIDIVLIAVVFILAALLLRLYAYQPEISITPWSKPPQKQEIDLNNPPLDLNLSVVSQNIYWQEGVNLTVRLKNNGKYTIKDIKLSLVSQSEDFPLSRLEFSSLQKTSLFGTEIKGFNLYLDELVPGTDREVNLLVYFQRKNPNSRIISWRLDSEYIVLNQGIKESFLLDDLKVASELSAQAAAYYNSPQGDQLGAGPFPPIVFFPTNFWVFFRLDVPADFRNFVMSARLADNVEFTDNSSLLEGKLSYNSDTHQIIWQVEKMEKDNNNNYQAGFEIELIPQENQVGSYAELLTNIKFQAVDYFTNLPVGGTLSNIDTSLDYDTINTNEGLVLSTDEL